MKWTNKGHEFDCLKPVFQKLDKKFYIWGAGTFGYAFWDEFKEKIDIEGFIDSKSEKQGKLFCGIPTISPDVFYRIKNEDSIVIVSTGWTNQVYSSLEGHGLKRNRDFFHCDDWYSLYYYFVENKVCISDLTLQVTEKCTLKCEYCNAFIPHIKNPKDWSTDEIILNLENIFKYVDVINVFGFGGGDAMARNGFVELVNIIADKYYPNKIRHFEVYSNAVIPLREEDINMLKKYNIIYRWTDYKEHARIQKSDEIEKVLKNNNILFDRVKFDSWYDCGYPQDSNGILEEDKLIDFCDMCDRKSCHLLIDNKFYTCGMCNAASKISYCCEESSDYFDVGIFCKDRCTEFLEYSLGFSEKGYYTYCKKCNGGGNVNNKIISVGKQRDIGR